MLSSLFLWITPACLFLGALYLASLAWSVCHFVYRHFLRPGLNLKTRYGPWCVVTGATDGIGKAYCFELAKQGLNVMLVSRTQHKLDSVAVEIKEKYPNVETRTLAVDFSSFRLGDPQHKIVADAIQDINVGVLVNNVGQSYPFPQYYHEIPDELVDSLIELNVNSTTWMTRIVLPGMVVRKSGAVVNISSIAGVTPSPLLSQYSSSKAFVGYQAKGLDIEYKSKGITFQVQTPLWVATKLSKIRNPSLLVPSPQTYARAAVATIGFETESVAYWAHDLVVGLISTADYFFPGRMGRAVLLPMHVAVRKQALGKKAKKEESKSNDKQE